LKLDLVQTVAFAGVVLFIGHGLKRAIRPLARYNIPAPVIGGLLVSTALLLVRRAGTLPIGFDTTLQTPLMIAFFTSVGFGASLSLLRVGGPLVMVFFVLATVVAIGQNVLGGVIAVLLGQSPLLGALAGSVTLTGGPATGLAFAPLFEAAGVPGAATIAVAAAMAGIVSGGLLGGPIGTLLIDWHGARAPVGRGSASRLRVAMHAVEDRLPEAPATAPAGEDVEAYGLTKMLVVMLVAMGLGGWLSAWLTALGVTLPAYIGAMLVAATLRNLDDATGVLGLSQRILDDLGSVALSLFLVLALMTLRLWELAGLALPLAIILAGQVALITVVCLWPVYRLMGRDYEAAVVSGGFCGFMLGTTANSMAVMESLVERYGPAPRAFLVVPIVGAFLIDFTNALIITAFLNLMG
jgi:ESS family glutamate:Na+ symporter